MNILFITSWYPNSQFALRGIFVQKHARAVKACGMNVKVLAFVINPSNKIWENKSKHFTDEFGIETELIEINSRFHKFLLVSISRQRKILRERLRSCFQGFKPDLVHSHVLNPAGILGDTVAAEMGIPHVMTEHWSKAGDYLANGLHKKKARKALSRVSALMPVSQFLAGTVSGFIPGERVFVVPNTIDTELFSYTEQRSDPARLVVTSVGNWREPKRPDIIFNSLDQYTKNAGKKVEFHCFGDGSLVMPLLNKKWSFKLIHYPFSESSRIPEILKITDYFLHASGLETFSIVVAEAICAGVPVIASDAGAVKELVNEGNGILCRNETGEWVKAIERIQSIPFDRKLMSERMREKVSLQNVGKRIVEVYQGALKSKRAG